MFLIKLLDHLLICGFLHHMKDNSLIKKIVKILIVTSLKLLDFLNSLQIGCTGEVTSRAQSELVHTVTLTFIFSSSHIRAVKLVFSPD